MAFDLRKTFRLNTLAVFALPIISVAQPVVPPVYPHFTISSLRPPGFNPQVSGLDFLPNGDLVVTTWYGFGNTSPGGPGNAYILKNVESGDSTKITVSTLASNLNEPLGLKVVNGQVYEVDMDSLVQLVLDSTNDTKLLSKKKVGGGWHRNAAAPNNGGKDLEFSEGLVYTPAPDNRFVVGLATDWPLGDVQSPERGCVIGLTLGKAGFDTLSCGIRSPNGMVIGPEDGIFVTDNQGDYVPADKLVQVKQGRFFSVIKNQASPFQNTPATPPVVWIPYGSSIDNLGISNTQPVYLTSGLFAHQMLVGDNNLGCLARIALEKVNGEYQGAVFRFSGGLQAGVNRMVVGPDGAIYLGGIGVDNSVWYGWSWNSQYYGLQRMVENNTPVFDVLDVRSTGTTTFALDFTEPAKAVSASNFTAQEWNYIIPSPSSESYGCCTGATKNLTVQSATLSSDGMTATLTINGLTQGDLVYIKFSGIASVSGRTMWSDRFWYTLNNFGPGTPVGVIENQRLQGNANRWNVRASAAPGGRLQATWYTGVEKAQVISLNGRVLETARNLNNDNGQWQSSKTYGHGIYLLRLGNQKTSITQRVAVP